MTGGARALALGGLAACCLLLPARDLHAQTASRRALRYAPAPAANPLKGLVPYAGARQNAFPHSMEFNYLPLSALVVGEEKYDWAPLEKLLNEIASRGHQAVFRVYLEYPGKKNAIPRYLLDAGLKVHRYTNTNTQPFPPQEVETPDYADPNLRRCLRSFVAALGRKYDGDPRIGFITAGLLGTWGEWHTYPRNELWAPKATQAEVLDAYEAAFKTTPILLRYPAGEDHYAQAANTARRFGYHDDSFAWATLDTGRKEDEWFFMPALKRAGALDKWKRFPIGGEIRPEAWGIVFDADAASKNPQVQDFTRCVEATHATWLMDSGMFRPGASLERIRRAEESVRRMGYEFHVPAYSCRVSGRNVQVTVAVENRGVAPFYYDWPVEAALLSPAGEPLHTSRLKGGPTGLLPGDPPRAWTGRLDASGLPRGRYTLALRVRNPLPGGVPLRFANETQDKDATGWLSLGPVAFR